MLPTFSARNPPSFSPGRGWGQAAHGVSGVGAFGAERLPSAMGIPTEYVDDQDDDVEAHRRFERRRGQTTGSPGYTALRVRDSW
jgi:hypothetical protein